MSLSKSCRANTKRWLAVTLLGGLLAVAGLPGCGGGSSTSTWPPGKAPRVLTSFPPIYCFVLNVAGDSAAVQTLLKTTGPHDYQPTSQDMLKVRDADLFFVNGLELDDHFASRLKENSGNAKLALVELGEQVKNKIRIGREEKEAEHDHGHGHSHHHGEFDPHVWLGIPEAVEMVGVIRDELKAKDPGNAQGYDDRAAAYIRKLKDLHEYGSKTFAGVKESDRKLISFHDSLQYFARSFGLKIAGVMEIRAGIAPDTNQFRKLVETCKKQGVRVIAVEPQYPPDAAKSLVEGAGKEGVTGIELVEIDPLETAQPQDLAGDGRDWYERKMRENIDRLRKAWK